MVGHQKYQANQVEGAGPLGLVLLTYEVLYKSLAQARAAIMANDIQAETHHISRALEAIIELSSSLDLEQGGEVADNLAKLYQYLSMRLGDGMCTFSTQSVDEAMALTQSLREGWIELAEQQHTQIAQQPTVGQQGSPRLRAYAG